MDYLNNTDIRDKYYFSKYVYKQKHHCLVFQSTFNRKLLKLDQVLKKINQNTIKNRTGKSIIYM